METYYQQVSRKAWDKARRKLFWFKFRAILNDQPSNLLSFDDVARCFQLRTPLYRGLQNIPIANIVGSVGRHRDFLQAFLPLNEAVQRRWQSVAGLYLDPASQEAPPIEVYQVGDAYFVKDGNHRVSVANQLGLIDIEAYVWQYPEPVVGLADTLDLDVALVETERQAFLTQTCLDELPLDDPIRLTVLEGYELIRGQIVYVQYILSRVDQTELSYAEAARAWYDLIYQPMVQVIKATGLVDLFPERTAADLYLWVKRHHQGLEQRFQKTVLIDEAAQDLETEHRPHLPLCFWWLYRYGLKRVGKLKLPAVIDPAFLTGSLANKSLRCAPGS